jgi:CRP-like cAMP-binding protein
VRVPLTVSNRVLVGLPAEVRGALLAALEAVSLPVGTVLYEPEEVPRYAHFITSGLASLVMETADGGSAEVMTIGNEGLIQAVHLLGLGEVPTRAFMQVAGTGLRMPFAELQAQLPVQGALMSAVLRYVQYQTAVVSVVAACNRLHSVDQRLARWLLMVQERIQSDELELTQQFLAEMLGARRTTVTEAAGILQRAGWIEYTRGRVRVLNRAGLQAAACECFQITSRYYQRL